MLKSNTSQAPQDKKLMGYVESEMGGFSDKFCVLDNNNSLPQNFVGAQEEIKIYTAEEERKIDKSEQDKRMNDIVKRRNDQDEFYKANNANILERAKRGEFVPSQRPSFSEAEASAPRRRSDGPVQ